MPDFCESHDFLNASTALRRAGSNRVFFNPEDQQHIDSLKVFLQTGNWGKFSFFCEAPYTDVPTTVLMQFAQYELSVKRETPAETQARLATKTLVVAAPAETAEEGRARLAEVNKKILAKA
jgi:hypothetical protein